MIDQAAVSWSSTWMTPCSSIGAIASPPRPENKYALPLSVVDAEPTRGDGADKDSSAFIALRSILPIAKGILYSLLSTGCRGLTSPPNSSVWLFDNEMICDDRLISLLSAICRHAAFAAIIEASRLFGNAIAGMK